MKQKHYCPKCSSRRIGKRIHGVYRPQSAQNKFDHLHRIEKRLHDARRQHNSERVEIITGHLQKAKTEFNQEMLQAIHRIEYVCGECGFAEEYYESPAGIANLGKHLEIEWLNINDDGPYR